MPPSKNDQVLQDIRGKIERERKLIQGFQQLKRNTNNTEVIQRCNTQIRDTQSNIDYLQETLSKVSLQQSEESNTATSSPRKDVSVSNGTNSRPVYTRLDLIKYDCPSLGHRIQYMLQQLQFKLQVENQYREANEKISQLYLMDGDKSSSVAAEGGRVESDQRIQLLNKSLKRYQDMYINVEEVSRDMEIMNTPKYARKSLSGKLNISITCIRDIDHIASPVFSKRPESVVSIKVDDVEKARTRPSRSGRWNEEFAIDIDKGNEIELTVYDKSGAHMVPVAVTWALVSDITEEIRKKKVNQEMGSAGWISASNLNNLNPKQQSQQKPIELPDSNYGNTLNADGSESQPSSSSQGDDSGKQVSVTTWLILEPVGQILVTMNFEKSTHTGGKQFMGALGRHGAIRQKKEEVYEQLGHQFVQKQFYNIMCCALCGEFLRYTGFQCQDCKFLCHKKCYQKVVTKCISKSSNEIDPDEAKLNHRIPHRFEPVLNRGTKWCCHCGYILPWGRKNVRKCTECGVMCHAQCTHLVPDFCGMSMEMANKVLSAIKTTRTQPKSPQTKSFATLQPTTGTLDSHAFKPSLTSATFDGTGETLHASDDDEYSSRLPTQTPNEQQQPTEAPQKTTARRQPPQDPYQHQHQHHQYQHQEQHQPQAQVPKQDDQDEYNQHNYTFTSAQSEDFSSPVEIQRNMLEPINEPQQELPTSGTHVPSAYNSAYGHEVEQGPPAEIISKQEVVQDPRLHGQPSEESSTSSPQRHSRRRRRKVGLDDFQFLAVLGKGNFGKVMLAESRHTSKLCAIKVLKKDFIVENDEADSVKSEKRVFLTANKEMHPFLLNLHCCFQTENRIYFVMEYISGGDLMWHIQKSRFSAKRAKFYACEVLLALKYFHDNGIVYRDLKLDNILLTTTGHIKIADYGLCKEEMWYGKTTGTFCGTPEFMAPEIIAGKQYDRSVDWWAFGVLLFQMLLCQSPFKGDDEDEIFNAIEHDDVRYPISMPRQTVLVLQALLTKDPAHRLGSGERDAKEIMEHSYFSDVDFNEVFNCQIQAPYIPEITSEHDYSNFDNEFTSETPRLTPVEIKLTSEMQEQFRGFSHISSDATI
ncbi:protein kinase C-like 1 [[Candida] anglica]|uniref:protein kinase C n=1 Tax=[Candida] anglica TaxID=148631 RepID=A0ABP0EAC2_9ASCO